MGLKMSGTESEYERLPAHVKVLDYVNKLYPMFLGVVCLAVFLSGRLEDRETKLHRIKTQTEPIAEDVSRLEEKVSLLQQRAEFQQNVLNEIKLEIQLIHERMQADDLREKRDTAAIESLKIDVAKLKERLNKTND